MLPSMFEKHKMYSNRAKSLLIVNLSNIISKSNEDFAMVRHCLLKGCVRYIFASFFFKSKLEHLSNWERCFLFDFKGSFRSQENQILEFYILKFHDVIKCLSIKQEKLYQNCGLKTSSRPFSVYKELSTTFIGK